MVMCKVVAMLLSMDVGVGAGVYVNHDFMI